MTESLITHLRHVDLAIPDYERQLAFYTQVWGLTEVATDSGIAFLAAEGSPERYIIRLRRDAGKRLDLVSFGAATEADVDALAGRLIARGVPIAQAVAAALGGEGPRVLRTPWPPRAAATACASSTSTAARWR
jgi:catechol 2,3-dioxygenase-like lactoylglutathione lyase family enzyme